jgi:hypothetical protein
MGPWQFSGGADTWTIDGRLDWAFVEIGLVGPLLLVAFSLLTRHRWFALGVVTLAGTCFFAYLWQRNWDRKETFGMNDPVWVEHDTPAGSASLGGDGILIVTGRGGIEFASTHDRMFLTARLRSLEYEADTLGTRFLWQRQGLAWPGASVETLYPGVWRRDTKFDQWGFRLAWANRVETEKASGLRLTSVTVPIWLPMSLLALLSLFAWRREFKRLRVAHRLRRGLCACGYDLRGHREALLEDKPIGGRCPECGRPIGPVADPKVVAAIRSWGKSSSVVRQTSLGIANPQPGKTEGSVAPPPFRQATT